MSSDWPIVRIEDIAEKVAMGPFGSNIKVSTFVDNGIPIISGQHLKGAKLIDGDNNFITEEHAEKLKNSNVFRGDVIFTHAGSIGQVVYIPENSKYEKYVISQRQFYLRCDRSKVLPEYVTYYFKSREGQHKLLANASQVGVPSIARPSSYLKTIEIPLPTLEEQQAIVRIVNSFEEKIELNRQINQTLEQIAQAIFKSWFVDFEPVKAKIEAKQSGQDPERAAMRAISGKTDEQLDALALGQRQQLTAIVGLFPDEFEDSELGVIPKGWEISSLSKLYKNTKDVVRTGPFGSNLHASDYDVEGIPLILVKHVMNGFIALNDLPLVNFNKAYELEQYKLKTNDIVVTRVGRVGDSAIVPKHQEGWMFSGQMLRIRIPDNSLNSFWFSYFCRSSAFQHNIESMSVGTTRASLNTKILAGMIFPNSGAELQNKFQMYVEALANRMDSNRIEGKNLSALRDLLLPKLLSSEITLDDTQSTVEAVA